MLTNVPYTFPALQAKARLFFLLTLLMAVPLAAAFWSGARSVGAASPAAAGPAPPPPPAPVVTVNAPANVFIGEPFKFTVTFDNANSAGVGFAPYVGVVLPGGGSNLDASGEKCDGITRDPASPPLMIKVNGGPLPLKFYETITSPCPNPNPGPIVTHPPGGPLPPVDVPQGGQLLTIELPFGSFEPDQEPVTVEITAVLSDYADINKPLTIYATGGFLLGADELSNPGADPPVRADGGNPSNAAAWAASATVTPKLMTFAKASTAPENEAVSGPNFVNYYPLRYVLDVDIARGQTINNLVVTDNIPPNAQYAGGLQVKIKGGNAVMSSGCPPTPGPLNVAVSQPSTSTPGGTLVVKLCRPITGALGPGDVTVTFAFYIPEKDVNNKDILAKDCSNSPVQVINDGKVSGFWTPLDPRDQSGATAVTSDDTQQDHVLLAKCLAIQKPVPKIVKEHAGGGAGYTPGDELMYELPFQVSDYRTVGKLVVRDYLSDGQLFLPGTATLTVTDQFGTKTGTMPPGAVGVANYQPNTKSCLASPAGSTVLTFNVSLAMASLPQSPRPRLTAGIMTGGHAAGLPPSPVPATGKISFRVRIRDEYQSLSGPDKFVDKHDKLSNCVNINGAVLQNVNRPVPVNAPANIPNTAIGVAQDNSATNFAIVPDKFSKRVYAVRRGGGFLCGGGNAPPCSNFPNPPQEVRPGDHVTYLIEKVIPSSDAEDLVIRDWLPLPVFNVAPMNFINAACGIPAAGQSCLALTDTMHQLVAPAKPVFSFNPTTNSIQFDYGTINDPNSQQKTIALLFTSTVTNKPFADGLFLSNDAVECEKHTFNPAAVCERAVARINLREPKLVIRKGIIAADNSNAVFTHPASPPTQPVATATPPPGVTFGLNGVNFSPNNVPGVVNSTHLATFPYFDSDIKGGVDANDTVTFAVVIENLGWAPAYDVKLEDLIPNVGGNPSCYTLDLNSLKVTRGSGVPVLPLLYTLTPSAASGPGFTIASTLPIPIADYNATNGSNIVIITFRAKLRADITPGCCQNVATLTNYASQPGGPNFVAAGLSPKPVDTAEVCVLPKAEKCISATSEPHTQPDNSTPAGPTVPLAVGEIVTFHLQVTLPEGGTPFFRMRDNLPAGLTYVPGTAKLSLISDNGITSPIPGLAGAQVKGSKADCKYRPKFALPSSQVSSVPPSTPFAPGVDPDFYLGTLTNNDNDNNLEYVVVEFNALVNNIPANVNNTTWSNTYDVLFGKQYTKLATSNNADVLIVEPNVVVQKSLGSVNATGHTPFTIKLTNTGGADAFDVRMDDAMPNMLTLWGGNPVPTVTAAPSGCVSPLPTAGLDLTNNTIGLSIPKLPQGCSVAVTFHVRVGTNCFTNTAKVLYSSLPGGLFNPPIGTQNNGTGSVTPCKSSTGDDCERLYNATGQASVTTGCTSAACAKPPPRMVSWWPLNETGGSTVADIKGGHAGTTSGAIGTGPNPAPLPKVGGALFFGSANASVAGPPYDFGKGSFSIDAWVRATPVSNAVSGIVDKLDTSSTPHTGYSFFVRNVAGSGRLQLIMGSATFTSSGAVAYGVWQHVAVTVQRVAGGAAVGAFYINGGYAGAFVPPPDDVSSPAALLLGSHRLNTGCQSCEVALDEVEIFDDVVPPHMIKAIYAAGPAGKCTSGLNGVSPARPIPLPGFSPAGRPD